MGTWTRQQKTNHGGAKCHHTIRRKNGPWGSGHLESQRSFHLQQSWAPPLANCTPTFHEIWGGHSTHGTMEGRSPALSALETECSPLTCLGTPGYLHALPFAPRRLPGEEASPARPPPSRPRGSTPEMKGQVTELVLALPAVEPRHPLTRASAASPSMTTPLVTPAPLGRAPSPRTLASVDTVST